MYMHLTRCEGTSHMRAGPFVPVRHPSPGVAGPYPALRAGTAAVGHACDSAHHPASALPCRRPDSRQTGRIPFPGQHNPDADFENHGPAGMDCGTSRERPARTAGSVLPKRLSSTRVQIFGLAVEAKPPLPSTMRVKLGNTPRTHRPQKLNGFGA